MLFPQEMVVEQHAKLKDHMYYLDGLVNTSRRVVQFKTLEPGWSSENIETKASELDEACKKNDVLIKLSKNLLASLKANNT